MILSALCDYYDAMLERDDGSVPPNGYSDELIAYVLVLDPSGALVDIQDHLDPTGKKPRPRRMSVPAALKRSGTLPRPNFLWDKTSYVLGVTATKDGDRAVGSHRPEGLRDHRDRSSKGNCCKLGHRLSGVVADFRPPMPGIASLRTRHSPEENSADPEKPPRAVRAAGRRLTGLPSPLPSRSLTPRELAEPPGAINASPEPKSTNVYHRNRPSSRYSKR